VLYSFFCSMLFIVFFSNLFWFLCDWICV
jgi:hypothetical protein